jgi:hypothetical protein
MTTPLKFEDAQRIVEETITEHVQRSAGYRHTDPLALLREVAERLRAASSMSDASAKQEWLEAERAAKGNGQ